jgi:hypothetical protein
VPVAPIGAPDDAAMGEADDAGISGDDDPIEGDVADVVAAGDEAVTEGADEEMPPSGAADTGEADGEADAGGELSAVPPLECEPAQAFARKRHAIATVIAPNEVASVFKGLAARCARRTR